jgi:hypothetical protein
MSYAPRVEEDDVVRFTSPFAGWPAGMSGTVACVWGGKVATVEIIEHPSGYTLDLLDVPVELLEVTWSQALQAAV